MKLDTPKPSDFDPYYRWLGIPRGLRPPNHYRLLGISPKEGDNDLIKAAVERQTLLVRNQKQPEQDKIATQLLYEIQEAGMVLLDPYRRKQYDASLEQSKPVAQQRSIPEAFPPYTPSSPVGEGNEIVRTYFGVMSIILGGFIIMAAVSFMLPWRKFLSNRPERGEPRNQPVVQAANAQPLNPGKAQPPGVAAPVIAKAAARQAAVRDPNRPVDESESATIEATIAAVDAPGRSINVTRNSKSVALDVSRIAKITVGGIEAALDALRPGQSATIEFDPKLDVATKIEVASASVKSQPAEPKASSPAVVAPKENDAALATVEVIVQQVDVDGRKLTVARNSKTTAFDVSRKAAIIVGGKAATLDSLKPNQKAAITFEPENEIVVRVEVAEPASGSPDPPPTSNNVGDDYLFDLNEHDLVVRFPQTFRRPFTVSGKKVKKGLILHPTDNGVSHVSFDLGGRYERFSGSIAIWDHAENRTKTPLVFEIYADQEIVWKSAPVKKTAATQIFEVPVAGKRGLELRVICRGPSDFANAVWIAPKLSRRK